MIDIDTFLTTLCVMVDDLCKTTLLPERYPICFQPEIAVSVVPRQAEACGLSRRMYASAAE
jgi:hypothetical protein